MNASNKLVAEWISTADDDLEYAKIGFSETDLFANVCFSCQQAFEKYLKAFLIGHAVKSPKTHNLVVLLLTCLSSKCKCND